MGLGTAPYRQPRSFTQHSMALPAGNLTSIGTFMPNRSGDSRVVKARFYFVETLLIATTSRTTSRTATTVPSPGRVEDWRRCSLGSAYLLLPVSVGSASLSEP